MAFADDLRTFAPGSRSAGVSTSRAKTLAVSGRRSCRDGCTLAGRVAVGYVFKPMALRRSVLCLLLVLPTTCGDALELLSLRAALTREYPDTQVGVSLTDGLILTVTLGDSPLLLAPCDRQVALAMRVAAFVGNHYACFDSLQVINIAFAPRRSRDPMAGSAARLPFRFARAAISAGLGPPDSTRAADTCKALEELQEHLVVP